MGKFQALQQTNNEEDNSEEDNGEDEDDIENIDTGKIFWFGEENAYAHYSGMK